MPRASRERLPWAYVRNNPDDKGIIASAMPPENGDDAALPAFHRRQRGGRFRTELNPITSAQRCADFELLPLWPRSSIASQPLHRAQTSEQTRFSQRRVAAAKPFVVAIGEKLLGVGEPRSAPSLIRESLVAATMLDVPQIIRPEVAPAPLGR